MTQYEGYGCTIESLSGHISQGELMEKRIQLESFFANALMDFYCRMVSKELDRIFDNDSYELSVDSLV